MSDNNDFFNFDDILADFSSYSANIINSDKPAEPKAPSRKPEPEKVSVPVEKPADKSPAPAKSEAYQGSSVMDELLREVQSSSAPETVYSEMYSKPEATAKPEPVRAPRTAPAGRPRPQAPQPVSPERHRPAAERLSQAEQAENRSLRRDIPQKRREVSFDSELMGMNERTIKAGAVKAPRPKKAPAQPAVAQEKAPLKKAQRPQKPQKPAPAPAAEKKGISAILSIVFSVLSILAFAWVFVNIHPDSGTAVGSALKSKVNMVEKFDNYANNAASDALGELSYIPKIYTIAEDLNVAPKPNPANFGSTTDPQEVMKIIESASALLGDQEVAFDPNATFIPGSEIKYYYDETILAIAWKEDNYGKCCSCAEVKIAHGSQIRRKVAGDTYSVGKRYYASDMAKECNSVVAINGDFYDFRPIGITVFQRELFRFNPGKLDTCHITSSGDFLFSYADELTDEESTRQFIKDNDVVFSLSFGPILIDNGQFRPIGGYPIGEVNTTYSRSAIGMLDELHYMLMTVNYDVGYTTAATLNEIGRYMEGKGCQKAYALDGGQTSVLMMNGELVNHVDYGNERTMSDIIYFATAIPEEEAAK